MQGAGHQQWQTMQVIDIYQKAVDDAFASKTVYVRVLRDLNDSVEGC
jgi:hypothetical protein